VDFDLFISHASEDKSFVRPLATALRDYAYSIWYDEFSLRVGDSLTERIDYGLANSAAGILVLSHAFIAKQWPKRELAGLVARQMTESARLIPIWHGLKLSEVVQFSPPLADIKALDSGAGIESIVRDISTVVKGSGSDKYDSRSIDNAQFSLDSGDLYAATQTAFMVFDHRLERLLDKLRSSTPKLRRRRHPRGPREGVAILKELGQLNVPPKTDLNFLLDALEAGYGVLSFAPLPRLTRKTVAKVVSQVAAFLRANPL
jgi:hypothetical protein